MSIPTPPVNPGKALDDLNTYVSWSGQTIGGLSGQVDALTAANLDLSAANIQLAAENTGLTAENARLSRELADCLGGPPPDPPPDTALATMFGASKNDAVPGYDKVDVGRVYYGNQISTTWRFGKCLDYVNHAVKAIWASFKADPDSAVESWIKSIADSPLVGFDFEGRKIKALLTVNHEPENDPVDVALYNRRYAALKAIADRYDYVLFGPIRMNSRSQVENDRYWPTVEVDFDGWDCYNPGIQNPRAYVAVDQVYSKPLASSAKTGKPLFIGETGTGKTSGDSSGSGRRTWAAQAHGFLADQKNVGPVLWWNSAGCAFSDKPTADSWLIG